MSETIETIGEKLKRLQEWASVKAYTDASCACEMPTPDQEALRQFSLDPAFADYVIGLEQSLEHATQAIMLGEDEKLTRMVKAESTLAARDAEIGEVKARAELIASEALCSLACAGISTPEEGYLNAPHLLAGDIAELELQRDTARSEVQSKVEELAKSRSECASLQSQLAAATKRIGELEGELEKVRKPRQTSNEPLSWEDEVHTCGDCNRRMVIVRPGKWQCPKCD